MPESWAEGYDLLPGYSLRLNMKYIWLTWGSEDLVAEVPCEYIRMRGVAQFKEFLDAQIKAHRRAQGGAAVLLWEVFGRGEEAGSTGS